jgi:type IV secretion system protein VirB6
MFSYIGGTFFSYVDQYVNQVSAQLSLYVAVVALAAATVYYIFVGYAVMRGEVHEPIKTIVWRSVKMAMILFVACSAGIYQTEVIGTINTVSASLMSSVASVNNGSCGNAAGGNAALLALLDCNTAKGMLVFDSIMKDFSTLHWYDLTQLLMLGSAAIIYALCYGLLLIAVGLDFFMNMLTLQLVLAVGPLFVGALAFEPTKGFFDGWKNKIVYCLILQLFIMILIGMAFAVINNYIIKSGFITMDGGFISNLGNELAAMKAVFSLCVVIVIFSYMFTKLDNIAASITGGGDSGSGLGMVATMYALGRMASGGGKKEGKQGGNIENSSPAGGGGKSGMSVAHRIAQRMRGK